MATWHQAQRPVTLNQPDGWTIVSDPPNGLRTLTTGFPARDEAEQRLALWRANNPEGHRHCYIVAPRDTRRALMRQRDAALKARDLATFHRLTREIAALPCPGVPSLTDADKRRFDRKGRS